MSALAASIPYFLYSIDASGVFKYFLSFSFGLLAKLAGLLIVFFFLRLIYVYFSSRKLWRIKIPGVDEIKALAASQSRDLPYFTIIVPARDESLVINNSINSYLDINYPRNRFELVVITDEKETRNSKNNGLTTQKVVKEAIVRLKQSNPDFNLKHLDVPYDFDGNLFGKQLGLEVQSTKGRAVNYGLSHINRNTDFCAFFDTDGVANKDSLLVVAQKYLEDNKKTLFQLPIFQCRNFWQISVFSKIISIGQSFTHECFLPQIMNFIPFLGGTNLFVKSDLLYEVGGFDNKSITEDLALGVELYLKTDTWPHFLALPSSEQTPPTIKTYFKQRFRWALGQIKVIEDLYKMKKEGKYLAKVNKIAWRIVLNGPIEWITYFSLTLVSFFVLTSRAFQGMFVIFNFKTLSLSLFSFHTINEVVYLFMSMAGVPLVLFSVFLLWRYRHYIADWPKGINKFLRYIWLLVVTLFGMPFILFIYPLPFVWALFQKMIFPQKEASWVKTPRTKEAVSVVN